MLPHLFDQTVILENLDIYLRQIEWAQPGEINIDKIIGGSVFL